MSRTRWWPVLVAVLAAGACTDTPLRPGAKPVDNLEIGGGGGGSSESCVIDYVTISPATATVPPGASVSFAAEARGRGSVGGSACTLPGVVSYTWGVSDPNVGFVSSGGATAYATVTAANPGATFVTVQAWHPSGSRSAGASFTVTTPTPSIGTISGPTSVSAAGTYQFSVSASGGNGSTYSYEWQKSTSGGASWTTVATPSGGSPVTASIGIGAGELAHLRVRAKSGNSSWSTHSPVHVVDATSAQPPPPPPPLQAGIYGPDFVPYGTWCSYSGWASGGVPPYSFGWISVGGLDDEWWSGDQYAILTSSGGMSIEMWMTVRDAAGQYLEIRKDVQKSSSASC